MQFNNQNATDEMNTKMLLMMPMVPKKHLHKVKLNHLKLYKVQNTQNSKNPEEFNTESNEGKSFIGAGSSFVAR